MGFADMPGVQLADTPMFHLALLHQPGHGIGHLGHRDTPVYAVLVVEVYRLDLQPAQGRLASGPDAAGTVVVTGGRHRIVAAELGGNDYPVAERSHRLSEQFFIQVGTVALGRVEEVAAPLVCVPDKPYHRLLVGMHAP